MNYQQKITLYVLLYITLCSAAFAQVVDIPDSNLRAAIRGTLNLPDSSPLTRSDMLDLTHIGYKNQGINDITGLEYATNLQSLALHVNAIVDIRPLTGLVHLYHLNLRKNRIVNISPLANLTQLRDLRLQDNSIVDITPLATLHNLKHLDISRNPAFDYSSLDNLALDYFGFDETCDCPPFDVRDRITNRTFPSIVSPWVGQRVLNRPDLSGIEKEATHDLWWSVWFGLRSKRTPQGRIMVGNIESAIQKRDEWLEHNPNMVFLVAVKLLTFPSEWFPEDWPHWTAYDPESKYNGVDFTQPVVQDIVVDQALAAEQCGLFDGVFIDHWNEEIHYLKPHRQTTLEDELIARDNILRRIRSQARPDFLIIGNTKRHAIPQSAPFMNGTFMETTAPCLNFPRTTEWKMSQSESTLLWAAHNLRQPRINALEGCSLTSEPPDSPTNLQWMRAFTTLSLTHSDGYVLFNHGHSHAHYWYDFWDADLGQPVGEKGQRYQGTDGLYIREFTNGWAVYNHSGESQEITLPELVAGVASGVEGTTHTLPNLDGEMYLRAKPVNPADVNGDGVINIFDLTLVAQAIGTGDGQGDVNEDGVVNVFDLVFVAGAIGGGGAAPSAYSLDSSIISAADVERWLAQTQGLGVSDANLQRGIRFLEGLLAVLTPKETTLLPNYPNPFNPETWIPYRLAREAEVAITIYDTKGTLVRRLALGNQAAGYYAERGKAAYWDGRNEDGEAVASGIYICQFRAGDYAASRRMVIVK